jgi:hypothetical protein
LYREAAEDVVDDRNREELLDLVVMQDSHVRVFSAMQQQVALVETPGIAHDKRWSFLTRQRSAIEVIR